MIDLNTNMTKMTDKKKLAQLNNNNNNNSLEETGANQLFSQISPSHLKKPKEYTVCGAHSISLLWVILMIEMAYIGSITVAFAAALPLELLNVSWQVLIAYVVLVIFWNTLIFLHGLALCKSNLYRLAIPHITFQILTASLFAILGLSMIIIGANGWIHLDETSTAGDQETLNRVLQPYEIRPENSVSSVPPLIMKTVDKLSSKFVDVVSESVRPSDFNKDIHIQKQDSQRRSFMRRLIALTISAGVLTFIFSIVLICGIKISLVAYKFLRDQCKIHLFSSVIGKVSPQALPRFQVTTTPVQPIILEEEEEEEEVTKEIDNSAKSDDSGYQMRSLKIKSESPTLFSSPDPDSLEDIEITPFNGNMSKKGLKKGKQTTVFGRPDLIAKYQLCADSPN